MNPILAALDALARAVLGCRAPAPTVPVAAAEAAMAAVLDHIGDAMTTAEWAIRTGPMRDYSHLEMADMVGVFATAVLTASDTFKPRGDDA